MSTSRPDTALDDVRLPLKARLAAAWTSFMFLYVYVDHFALYKPGYLDELLAGRVHEFDTGPTFIGAGLTLVAVPSLMIVLSMTLPARVNRVVNLVVAALYLPVTVYNVAGEPMSYAYFYGLSIGLEVLLLAYIAWSAWAWPRVAAPAAEAAGAGLPTGKSANSPVG